MLSKPILRRLVLLGTPLATAVVMLFHPAPYSDLAGELVPIAGWWTTIHAIQFVLFAFMARRSECLPTAYAGQPPRSARWRR